MPSLTELKEKVRVTSTQQDPITRTGSVTMSYLQGDEVDNVAGFVNGQSWMRVENGRLRFQPTTNPLPGPADDEEMMPFWRRPSEQEREVLRKDTNFDPTKDIEHHQPSFIIQHLCGYNYTPENYRRMADKLESWGFDCLRSRRGKEGRYWELWFLPSLWFAKGELKKFIGGKANSKEAVDRVVSWLCSNASFGTLDVVIQQAAMLPD